jgi:predicted nucleotidyltransferase
MSFLERENEIFKFLDYLIERKVDFIVVGGYAVSSLGKHRFSVDCDLTISKKQLKPITDALQTNNFEKSIEKKGFDQIYGGEFINFKRLIGGFPITIDLLIDSLVCRSTAAAWSYDYITKESIEMNVTGLEMAVRCKVPKKELMIAFKIHAGRKTDIRDFIMLQENVDLKTIVKHINRGNIDILKSQINNMLKSFDDPNLVDSLKGVFSMKGEVERQIETAKKLLIQILNSL